MKPKPPRVCFIYDEYSAACGRYRRPHMMRVTSFRVEIVTLDARQVNCRACWRTRAWRRALGVIVPAQYKIKRIAPALEVSHIYLPSHGSQKD